MKKVIIFCILSVSLIACKKGFLDITPDGRMSMEEVFADEKRTEAYLNTVYSNIPSYFWKYEFFNFLAAYTDECYAYGGNVIAWWAGALSPSGNPIANVQERGKGSNHYPTFWKGIKDANVFLSNIDNANLTSEVNRNRFKGEAQSLRAFYFWELIKEFGPLPIITEPFTPDFDYTTLQRPTFQECVDFIVAECDDAINNKDLPIRITTEGERGRFTKAVAYAIKSEALLYNASPLWNPENNTSKWQAASTATQDAINKLTGSGYGLIGFENYEEYFLNRSDISSSPSDKETIYEINEPPTDPVFSIINGIPSKPGTFKVGATPTQELVDSYDMQATGEPAILGYEDEEHLEPIINPASGYVDNNPYVGRDPRFYATVWYNGAQYDNIGGNIHTMETFQGGSDQILEAPIGWDFTRTGYYLRKFVDPKIQPGQPENAKWKKYRMAELYLNLAEAENEANGPTAIAYDAVNTIRNRALMPSLPAGLTKEQMRDRIHRERRVELAIEEHRFWDVRRWKILDKTDKIATGMRISFKTDVSMPDGGFEENSPNWIFLQGASRSTEDSHSGSASVKIGGGDGGLAIQIVEVSPNTMYMVSGWIKVTSGAGVIGAQEYGGDPVGAPAFSPEWTKVTQTFTTGPTNTTAIVGTLWEPGSTGYVDDFEIVRVNHKRIVTEERNAWQDKYRILPIPSSETAIIPDFNLNQNPGW